MNSGHGVTSISYELEYALTSGTPTQDSHGSCTFDYSGRTFTDPCLNSSRLLSTFSSRPPLNHTIQTRDIQHVKASPGNRPTAKHIPIACRGESLVLSALRKLKADVAKLKDDYQAITATRKSPTTVKPDHALLQKPMRTLDKLHHVELLLIETQESLESISNRLDLTELKLGHQT